MWGMWNWCCSSEACPRIFANFTNLRELNPCREGQNKFQLERPPQTPPREGLLGCAYLKTRMLFFQYNTNTQRDAILPWLKSANTRTTGIGLDELEAEKNLHPEARSASIIVVKKQQLIHFQRRRCWT